MGQEKNYWKAKIELLTGSEPWEKSSLGHWWGLASIPWPDYTVHHRFLAAFICLKVDCFFLWLLMDMGCWQSEFSWSLLSDLKGTAARSHCQDLQITMYKGLTFVWFMAVISRVLWNYMMNRNLTQVCINILRSLVVCIRMWLCISLSIIESATMCDAMFPLIYQNCISHYISVFINRNIEQ